VGRIDIKRPSTDGIDPPARFATAAKHERVHVGAFDHRELKVTIEWRGCDGVPCRLGHVGAWVCLETNKLMLKA
jgi:hypothetical protein